MLTPEEIKDALPPRFKSHATPEFAARVNTLATDPQAAQQFAQNFVSYANVLKEGRFKLQDYLNAVVFVSYKMMNLPARDAYARTFPDRYKALVAKGTSDKDISSYVSMYNQNKLVNLIFEQTVIPTHILNAPSYQEAINVQVELMRTAKSEKVRSDAANSLLTHLKRPESTKVEIDVGITETSGMRELREALTSLAESQQKTINQGTPTREIAHQEFARTPEIIDAEVVEADPD